MNLPRPAPEGFVFFDSLPRVCKLSPIEEHRRNEALSSADVPELTEQDIETMAARDAQRRETNRVEGRILTPKTPAHINPHE